MEDFYDDAKERTLPLSECSAYEYIRRLNFWPDKDKWAFRLNQKRFRAQDNACKHHPLSNRHHYWMKCVINIERKMMKRFKSLPGN